MLDKGMINVAPTPILAWLEGLDDGVAGRMVVFGGVLVGRGVAAAHVTTNKTKAQMDPPVAGLQAIFTTLCAGSYRSNLVNMLTIHH
jgi:hypothetical protein